MTSLLGKKGYNAVRVGEAFAVSAAAKGAATLEVSVASSSRATGRFTATRRVKVC